MTNTTTQLQDHVGLRAPLLFAAVILLGFGLSYSLAGAALGRVLFPASATGSTIERDGKVIGSALVAQPFADARYFQPRPSAANYDPMASAGSSCLSVLRRVLRRMLKASRTTRSSRR